MNRLLAVCLVSILASCKADDDSIVPDVILDLSSQYYFDINANPTGRSTSDIPEDFAQETWTSWERDLFAPLDTARLPVSATDSVRVYLFPNPCNGVQSLYSYASDSINCKVVLVDRARNPLFRRSFIDSANLKRQFDWRTIAPANDSQFRVYYAFSTQARPYFHTSHADITIRR